MPAQSTAYMLHLTYGALLSRLTFANWRCRAVLLCQVMRCVCRAWRDGFDQTVKCLTLHSNVLLLPQSPTHFPNMQHLVVSHISHSGAQVGGLEVAETAAVATTQQCCCRCWQLLAGSIIIIIHHITNSKQSINTVGPALARFMMSAYVL
jgi:hypothetical protein